MFQINILHAFFTMPSAVSSLLKEIFADIQQ